MAELRCAPPRLLPALLLCSGVGSAGAAIAGEQSPGDHSGQDEQTEVRIGAGLVPLWFSAYGGGFDAHGAGIVLSSGALGAAGQIDLWFDDTGSVGAHAVIVAPLFSAEQGDPVGSFELLHARLSLVLSLLVWQDQAREWDLELMLGMGVAIVWLGGGDHRSSDYAGIGPCLYLKSRLTWWVTSPVGIALTVSTGADWTFNLGDPAEDVDGETLNALQLLSMEVLACFRF